MMNPKGCEGACRLGLAHCGGRLVPRLCELAATRPDYAAFLRDGGGLPGRDRRPRRAVAPGCRPRVGFWSAIASVTGGTETWHDLLLPRLDPGLVELAGLAILDPGSDPAMVARLSAHAPTGLGPAAMADLAARSDIIVHWGLEDPGRALAGPADRPTMVAVSHGDATSDWTRARIAAADAAGLADRIVAVAAAALGPLPPHRLADAVVLPNGVDPARSLPRVPRAETRARWGLPPGAIALGYLGRFSDEKDPHALLRALPHLPPEWHAVFVGGGHHGGGLRAEAARLAPGRAHFPGPTADIGSALAAFDTLVVPSLTDGYCLVLAEGWCAGVPAIATPVGIALDHPDLVRPIPRDVDGPTLAAAALADHADHATATRALRARELAIRHLTADAFAARWSRFLSEIAHAPSAIAHAPSAIAHAPLGPALAAVMACDRRGPEVEGSPCGCGHAPLRRCADGPDVTLNQCLQCLSS